MPDRFTEGMHAGEHLLSESNHTRSREAVTILAGSGAERALLAGMVLGKVRGAVSVAAFTLADDGKANVGNGTFAATPVAGAGSKEGNYRLVVIEPATDSGTFELYDPDGKLVGVGVIGVAFDEQLQFTLDDSTTDFVAGDGFNITVAPGTKYVQFNQDGSDGSEIAVGVLFGDVTAPDGADAAGVAHVRDCELKSNRLVWPSDIEVAEQTAAEAQLAAQGIVLR